MYEKLITIMQKRLSLESLDFEKIDMEQYYALCDKETMLRENILKDMCKRNVDINEDKYATIKVVDEELEITIKDFQP